MAHSANIISKIKLPGSTTVYEIHDAQAIHDLADLGLDRVMQFKGVVASASNLPETGSVGDVYHIIDTDAEVVWTDNGEWEDFGSKFITDHTHSFSASGSISDGSAAAQKWTQKSGTAAAQEWTQSTGTISGSGSVSIPKVTKSANYAKVSTGSDSFVKSYPGVTSKLDQISIIPAVDTGETFVKSVSSTSGSVTGVNGSTTASKATAGTAIAVAKVGTSTKVATGVTGGSVASWSGTVDSDGLLTISWTANTLQTASTTNITPATSAGNITPYTFTDVTVPVAAASATTVITAITPTSSTNKVAKVGTAVNVADGTLSSTGTGASIMTGLGTASTASALTSASLAEGTSADGLNVGDTVAISSESKTVSITGSATVTGTNAASNVTVTGTNEASVVTGTVSHSGTTELPQEA